MWQMDALRRLAAGELAEVVGKAGLESDQDARRWRMQRDRRGAGAPAHSRQPRDSRGVCARSELLLRDPSRPSGARIRGAPLRSPPLARARFAAGDSSDVSHARLQLARGHEQVSNARARRRGQGEFSVPAPHRQRGPARIQRLGDFRRALRHRQTDPGQRSASGMDRARRMVPGPSEGSRSGCGRRNPAGHSGSDHRATIAASPGASPTWASTFRICIASRSISKTAATSFRAASSRLAWSATSSP